MTDKPDVGRRAPPPVAAFGPGAVPAAIWPFLKRSNFAGVRIYDSGTGWWADLLRRISAPVGGSIIGAKAAEGCSTREEAVAAATDMPTTVTLIETG